VPLRGAVVTVLAITHTVLALGAGSAPALGGLILLAGATIAPSYTVIYAIAADAAPPAPRPRPSHG